MCFGITSEEVFQCNGIMATSYAMANTNPAKGEVIVQFRAEIRKTFPPDFMPDFSKVKKVAMAGTALRDPLPEQQPLAKQVNILQTDSTGSRLTAAKDLDTARVTAIENFGVSAVVMATLQASA
ncbi:hypothetical protein J6590_086035 [Homalodisca vitripennis]|nr:hypothetical protein J6590_086035 [Homalodisca vitripennis]